MEEDDCKSKSASHLFLRHGSERHLLPLPDLQNGGTELTVKELALLVQQYTEVPVESQKLIHKGQSLSNMDAVISQYGVGPGSKIMLIGNKPNVSIETEEFQAITKVEKSLNNLDSELNNVAVEVDGIEKGFLPQNLHKQSLQKLRKQIKALSEDCMKKMELLDGISLEDKAKDIRLKRKVVIDRIQTILQRSDVQLENIDDLLSQRNNS